VPSIAPLVAAMRRRLSNLPAPPAAASGETGSGQPVQVELLLGGTWVDITATSSVLVRDDSGQIHITYGITGGEGSQTERAQATVQLRNIDGRFTPRNPTGIYYGLIGRNTPMRISVPDGAGGKNYRLWGQVSDWAPSADLSGNDVFTDTTVAGIMQALAQAPAPERSVIYNAILDPAPPGLRAYWPMEDATGATSLASALTSGSPMTWTGTPTLASYEDVTASDPLPDISTASLTGGVGKYDDPTASQIRFLAYIPASGLSDGKVLCAFDQTDYSAGSAQFWELYYSTSDASNSLVLRTCASDGTVLGAILPSTVDVRGRLLYVSVELQEAGTGITRQVQLKDVLTSHVYTVSDTETLTQLTRVTKVAFGVAARAVSGPAGSANLPGVTVGHATVENAITAIDALGVRINTIGETAGRRIQRLCGEQGIPFDWIGDLDDTVALGAQPKQNLLALVQEACLADGGLLYENRDVLGLGYRTRASLYNQGVAISLSWSGGQLAQQTPSPVDDDRQLQNTLTVTVGGVSASYTQTDGPLGTDALGAYGETSGLTLNLASTDTPTLLDQAAWRVHLGTVDEARFPSISVNLAHPSITPDMRRAILGLRLGDRMQVTGLPSWLPPDTIDQLVLGMDENLTQFEHRLIFSCAPASPYSSAGFLDQADTRSDTDGSELVANISTTDTVCAVQPSGALDILWTKDPADFPLDIKVSGEVIRVTSITDLVTDTFTRTVSNGWGTNDTGFLWQTGGGTAADYSVSGGTGKHILATAGNSRRCFLTTISADFDFYVSVTSDQLAAGGVLTGGLTARYVDSDNLYHAFAQFSTTNAVSVGILKRVNAVETAIGSYLMPGVTFVAGTMYRIRFKIKGSSLKAKIWLATDAETPEWQIDIQDGDLVVPQFVGLRSISAPASTNVNPTISYDDFSIVNPQLFNLTRSVNGVVKAHSAGDDVRLATPTYLPL
jgi:hypothetical protein